MFYYPIKLWAVSPDTLALRCILLKPMFKNLLFTKILKSEIQPIIKLCNYYKCNAHPIFNLLIS